MINILKIILWLNNKIEEIKIENKEFREKEDKIIEDNILIKNQINETKIQIKELRDIDGILFENYALLNNKIEEIKIENQEFREKGDKILEDNTLINNKINEITIQYKDLKDIDDKLFSENSSLNNQINEIKTENINLKEQILKNDNKLQSGDYYFDFYFPDSENYEAMRTFGWREFKYHVNFDKVYEKKPQVIVSINQLDSNKDKNVRINVFAADIDTTGFDLKIQTWDDSIIYSARIAWISFE